MRETKAAYTFKVNGANYLTSENGLFKIMFMLEFAKSSSSFDQKNNPRTPRKTPKRHLSSFTLGPSASYFWSEVEHLHFIKLFWNQGRCWKSIAQQIEGRSTLQCRTHGQKYLKALADTRNSIESALKEVLANKLNSNSSKLCQIINKYETQRRNLVKSFQSSDIDKYAPFVPSYLFSQAKTCNFADKLRQILAAIDHEIQTR